MMGYILIGCLLFSLVSTIITSNDDAVSKWVQKALINNTIDEDEDIDLTRNTNEDYEEIDLTPTDYSTDFNCHLANGETGVCVVYYLCDPDTHTIVTDGITIIDMRQGECLSYLETCCARSNILKADATTSTAKSPKLNPEDIVHFNDDQETIRTGDDKMLNLPPGGDWSSQCGWDVPSIFVSSMKDSTAYANFGEFPWAVAVIKKFNTSVWSPNDYLGGGTLIHPSAVLTVAHKVDKLKASMIKIRAGEWDTQTVKEKYQYQERNVKKIIIHPQFFKTSLYFDVALLIMASPFDLASAPHIKPVCLGASLPTPGTECFSMGWGKDFYNDYKDVNILKKVQLPLVGSDECTQKLQKSRLGEYFKIHSSLTCAGGKTGVDTCEGDGGSALVCPIEKRDNHTRYVAYGLVAYGIDCGQADRPGVYANIPTALPWINQEMTKENLGTATYNL